MKLEKKDNVRTNTQNRAMHLYFRLVAEALADAGLDMNVLLKQGVSVPPSAVLIKEMVWKPILRAHSLKDSTTKMTTAEIDRIYDIVNRHLGEATGIYVPWPTLEEEMGA